MDPNQDQGQQVEVNPADLPLVTFDNNVLIALENGEPAAKFVELLLKFNRERRITIKITVSTMLERQRDGREPDIQYFAAQLKALGIADDCIFVHDSTYGFQIPGQPNGVMFDMDLQWSVQHTIHSAIFPNIPYMWCDYLDQECQNKYGPLGDERVRAYREALADIEGQRNRGGVPPMPNLLGEWPLSHIEALTLEEQHQLRTLSNKLHRNWFNKKNDSLGLNTHLTHALQTTCPHHSVFVTSDHDLLKQTTINPLRQFKFPGQILPPDEAVAYLDNVMGSGNTSPGPKL